MYMAYIIISNAFFKSLFTKQIKRTFLKNYMIPSIHPSMEPTVPQLSEDKRSVWAVSLSKG